MPFRPVGETSTETQPKKLKFRPVQDDQMIIQPPSFEDQYIQSAEAPLGQKLASALQGGATAIGGLLDLGKRGIEGRAAQARQVVGDIEEANDIAGALQALGRGGLREVQTGVETGARVAFDVGDALRRALSYGGSKILENPIAAAGGIGPLATALAAQGLSSQTPSQLEIALAEARDSQNKVFDARKQTPLVPEFTGQPSNLDVANLSSVLLQGALPVPKGLSVSGAGASRIPPVIGAAAPPATIPLTQALVDLVKPIAETIPNTGAGRVVSGAANLGKEAVNVVAKGAISAVTPKTILDDAINAFAPRARAIDPKKQVLAIDNAKSAWKTISPYIPEQYQKGNSVESSLSTADMMSDVKANAFARRSELAGQPIQVSLDPMAQAIDKLLKDKVILREFPDEIPILEDLAKRYRGAVVPAEEAERLNRVFNATVEQKLAALPGSDRARKLTSAPELRARSDASKALKKSLQQSLGGEFSDLGKLYGAASELEEHALNQAVRQFKIENNMSLGEQLAAGGVGGSPWSTAFGLVQAKAVKMAGSPDSKFKTLHGRIVKEIEKGGQSFGKVPTPTAPIVPPANVQDLLIQNLGTQAEPFY